MESSFQNSSEADFYRPLIAYIHAKKKNQNVPFFLPNIHAMPLHNLSKFALLLKEAGFETEASNLISFIDKTKDFITLWCKESEFNEAKIRKEVKKLEGLLTRSSHTISSEVVQDGTLKESSLINGLNVEYLEINGVDALFSLTGHQTSMGMIRAGSEIRAIGPQKDPKNFGISGVGMNGWARCFYNPEIWIEMKAEKRSDFLQIKFNLCGIPQEEPMDLAFYVKSQKCQIKNQIFLPKSLNRFIGNSDKILFEDNLNIELNQERKIELIPLAGEGYFWDSQFLLTFELTHFNPSVSFIIRNLSAN